MKVFEDWANELIEYFRDEKGAPFDPPPKLKVDMSAHSRFDPFVPTGHYDFRNDEITLYASNRQCKDVLRTLAHELVHAVQWRKNPQAYEQFDKSGDIASNDTLRKLEKEAYEKGNLWFRDWTESKAGRT